MNELRKLLHYVKPYWKQSLLALTLITGGVFMDLAIPRLVQRIIDEGITGGDMSVVTDTTLLMLGISVLSTLFAIGNNFLSVQAGEGFARDLRDASFPKDPVALLWQSGPHADRPADRAADQRCHHAPAPGPDVAADRHAGSAAHDRQLHPDDLRPTYA